jgi:hypothetical protein
MFDVPRRVNDLCTGYNSGVHSLPTTLDEIPSGFGSFEAQIRTKWYRVNMNLYANDLFNGLSEAGEISSDLGEIGSEGRTRIRLRRTSRLQSAVAD